MWRKVAGCLLASGLAAAAASGQTAGELVAKNIQAKGGGKYRSLKTVRMSGTLTVAGTEGRPLLLEFALPGHKVRMEMTTQKGETDVRVYDGTTGWALLRSQGDRQPTRLEGDALKEIKSTADFQGGLYDYEAKGNRVEYLGKDEISGTPAYKLKLTESDGEETTIYLDAKTYLELEVKSTHGRRGETSQTVTSFSDYKQVEGLTLPFNITATSREELGGGSIRMEGSVVVALDKVEIDVDLPASRFAKPQAEAEARKVP